VPAHDRLGKDSLVVRASLVAACRAQAIPPAVVFIGRPGLRKNSPPLQRQPIDATREPLYVAPGAASNDANPILVIIERSDESGLGHSRPGLHVGRCDTGIAFELRVEPRNEERVSQPGLDDRGAGEERVREGVTNAPDPQLVARVLLVEESHRLPHPEAFRRRIIYPGDEGWHVSRDGQGRSCA
jgi:hypothetical protein